MNVERILSTIKELTTSVFENRINQVEEEKSINEIHLYFQHITTISGYDFSIENLAAIPAAKGKALGLNHAAQCLLDYKRTVQFLKAIVTVIKEKQKNQPGKLINIFYAGCGPYAPFITLVAPLFKAEEVQFTLLEINKNSVASAKKLIHSLGLSNYLKNFYIADAVTFEVPNPDSFDILISETLDVMLYRECYVPILLNLLPQFNKDIVLIPENVLINLSFLTQAETDSEIKEYEIGNVVNVRESIASNSNSGAIPSQLSDKTFDLTTMDINKYETFLLDTKVHVYKDIWLNRNESPLTAPLKYTFTKPIHNNQIVFTYYIEPEIELKFKFV